MIPTCHRGLQPVRERYQVRERTGEVPSGEQPDRDSSVDQYFEENHRNLCSSAQPERSEVGNLKFIGFYLELNTQFSLLSYLQLHDLLEYEFT